MARYSAITVNDTTGGIAELIPAVIVPEIVDTAAREEVFMPLARRFDLTGAGDDFTVPQAGALAWGAYSDHSSGPTETAFDTGGCVLTPTLRVLDVIIPIEVAQASALNLEQAIIREAGIGLAASHDAAFAALYAEASATSPDHLGIGTNGVALSFVSLRSALDLLYLQEAPRRFAWVVYPTQWTGELLLDDTLINASVKGSPVLTQGVQPGGFITSVLDVDIYVSPQILESSGRHSMMFSKNAALGYGFKRLQHPVTGAANEVLMDIDWNSAQRTIEMNMTYHADFESVKGGSTANNWLVDYIS